MRQQALGLYKDQKMSSLLRKLRSSGIAVLLSTTLFVACSPVDGQTEGSAQQLVRTKAFPTAIGHGAASLGGRGGKIIAVTTLADRTAGSLRACVEATGARTCVFRVAGVFRFTGTPPVIRNPYLTIAGQTAPGGGVTIAHDGGPESRTPLLIKNTSDVVVRHVRVRNDRIGGEKESEDSITIENSKYVIVDHVSGSWARDEVINGYGNNDFVTISNSIFAYGIPKHDKCALLASDPKNVQKFSFVGNICAHSGDRNPDINFKPASCVEVVNNIFYNAGSEFAEVWETYGGTPVALVGNSFKAGPDTVSQAPGVVRQTIGSKGMASIYLQDNQFFGSFNHIDASVAVAQKNTPPCPLTLTPASASAAYDSVLAKSGAWPRDAIDATVVTDVRNRTGNIVSLPGAIPAIAAGTPYPDSDNDGMDDRWEAGAGAKVGVADAWLDGNKDGTLNFDAFLDHLERNLLR
jgi:pectate lyase